MFLTAEEADDLSYDYRHSYSGGPGDGKYVSGGPGDTGRNPASTGGPVWQQAADRIFPPHGATIGALIRAANGSSLKMEATRWAAGCR